MDAALDKKGKSSKAKGKKNFRNNIISKGKE